MLYAIKFYGIKHERNKLCVISMDSTILGWKKNNKAAATKLFLLEEKKSHSVKYP